MKLSKAMAARQVKALDTKRNFSHGLDTFRNAIESGVYCATYSVEQPKIQYNRCKFNRMNVVEQRAYEIRLKETKTIYALESAINPGSITYCPKMVFDWAQDYFDNNA